MKINISRIDSGEEELTLRYREVTPMVKRILDAVNGENHRLVGRMMMGR